METNDMNQQHNTLWWITSLAISVTCCAILFVVFAGYVVSIKEELSMARLRSDMVDQRLNLMNGQMEALYHRAAMPAAAPSTPAPVSAPMPAPPAPTETAPAPAAAPAAAPAPAAVTLPGPAETPAVAPMATTPAAPVTPAPAAPTAVPEVPATR